MTHVWGGCCCYCCCGCASPSWTTTPRRGWLADRRLSGDGKLFAGRRTLADTTPPGTGTQTRTLHARAKSRCEYDVKTAKTNRLSTPVDKIYEIYTCNTLHGTELARVYGETIIFYNNISNRRLVVIWMGDRWALASGGNNCERHRASAKRELTPVRMRARVIDYRSACVRAVCGWAACARYRVCADTGWPPPRRCDQRDEPRVVRLAGALRSVPRARMVALLSPSVGQGSARFHSAHRSGSAHPHESAPPGTRCSVSVALGHPFRRMCVVRHRRSCTRTLISIFTNKLSSTFSLSQFKG